MSCKVLVGANMAEKFGEKLSEDCRVRVGGERPSAAPVGLAAGMAAGGELIFIGAVGLVDVDVFEFAEVAEAVVVAVLV